MVALVCDGSNELPRSIQEICGQKMVFQFRLTDYNFQSCKPDYTVSRLFLMDENSLTVNVGNDEKVQNFANCIGLFYVKLCENKVKN